MSVLKTFIHRFKIALYFVLVFFTVCASYCQNADLGQKSNDVYLTINKYHYTQKELNDSFAAVIFSEFIHAVDAKGYLLTTEDISDLQPFANFIDKDIRLFTTRFIDEAKRRLHLRMSEVDSVLQSWSTKSFDFEQKEEFIVSSETKRSNNHKSLIEKWRKKVKYRTLTYVLEETAFDSTSEYSINNLQATIVHIIDKERCRLLSLVNQKNSSRLASGRIEESLKT